jgi:hypothetical protein
MTRRIRALLSLLVLTFAFSAAACADANAPQQETKQCDHNNPWTAC